MTEFQAAMILMDNTTTLMADEDYSKSETMTFIFVIAVSVVVLIVTTILAMYITRSLTAPIKEIEAAASEELSGQAQMLKNLVGWFKLLEGGWEPASPAPEAGMSVSMPAQTSLGEAKY